MKNIQALLNADKNVSGYRVIQTKTESHELFFVHKKLETVRTTDTCDTRVTVYVDHDGKTGDSTFAVYSSMSDSEIKDGIAAAAERAKLVFNEPYTPVEGNEEKTELKSELADIPMADAAEKIADAVFAADCGEGCSINATEIFVYRVTTHVVNSRGVDKTEVKHHAMIEAIPTFTDEKLSVELYEAYRSTSLDTDDITREISEKMQEVALRYKAIKPETPIKANIVLRSQEITGLMGELSYDLEYSGVYTHSNLHKKGDILQSGDCDRITLTRCGSMEGSFASRSFDDDGVTLTQQTLIKDGEVVGYFGSHRFAYYLGEPDTGSLGCIKLECGTLEASELEKAPYIECVSMSGLQVDLYNDYIGGEIRLAYMHDGEKVTPITGITMSGKLSEVLSGMRLSSKAVVSGRYSGPDKMLIKNITVM